VVHLSEKGITLEIRAPEILILLLFLTFVFALELRVTLNTPISFGDEGFHTRMAQWIGENREYPVWRPFEGSDIDRVAFERPPLWNILEGGIIFLVGYHEFIIKSLTPFIAVLTGLALFILAKRLYNEKVAFIASAIFVTIPSFVTYSVLFYTDILFTFYFMMFFLTFLMYMKDRSKKYWLLSAAFGGLAFLTKLPGVVVILFVGFMFVYELLKNFKTGNRLEIIKSYSLFIILMGAVCSGFLIRNIIYYKTPHCNIPIPFFNPVCNIDEFEDKYSFAGRTEAAGTEVGVLSMGLTNYLDFAYGNVWFVIFGLLGGIILMGAKKDQKDLVILFIVLLMSLIIYQSDISFRAEDTARHTLGWAPFIAIIAASYFEEVYNFIKQYQKYLALVVFVFVVVIGYQNMDGKLQVMDQVKQFSPSFFEACDWVKENVPKGSLITTVWTHRTTYSCQRNVIGAFPDIRLSRDLNYTLDVAKQHRVTHIFIQKFSIDYQNRQLQETYDWDFVKFIEDNSEHFKKIYENGPSLDQCRQVGGCDGNLIYEIIY